MTIYLHFQIAFNKMHLCSLSMVYACPDYNSTTGETLLMVVFLTFHIRVSCSVRHTYIRPVFIVLVEKGHFEKRELGFEC